ncbi:cysteine hydrolase [Nesterenkonia sp. MY13]|uniref:Cysteine hydrolase n=1 Tax=Nesterenkonia sedimenti TaxID=1463632 RepID=A0A7X8TKT4_9MICC|nr:cysteine hydrolase family protein [Nesterenkonia sedimenti]NLS10518.1 cysteine hydrolase [Nesterenkonia sedimenti]
MEQTPTTARPALLVIDVQQGFDDAEYWGQRNNPDCETHIAALIQTWQAKDLPVVFVRHDSSDPESPLHPSSPGNALRPILSGEPQLLVTKSVNSSFHGSPDLHAWLQQENISELVICGVTTNHCCETTARVGGNLGYEVYFALDATHTFDRTSPAGAVIAADTLREVTATNLHGEFATVTTTAALTSD